jgi:hypothetical protein
MTTPTVTISATDIRNEFGASGANNSVSLGNYRVSQTVSGMTNLALDNGYDINGNIVPLVPQGTSAIGFGNLREKKLNVVIDYTAPPGQWKTKVSARQDYNDNNNLTVIGAFKSRPSSSAGTKVIIHTNGNIGSYVYLSRGSKGVYCTYDVIVGYDEFGIEIYETQTNLYGYLHFYASFSEITSTDFTIESKYYIRMFPGQEPNTTPLYRLYNPNNLDYLYTIDVNEWNNSGYVQEAIVGYVYGYAAPSTQPVYRGYKIYDTPSSGVCATLIDRLLATDINELSNNGYTIEFSNNPAFYAPTFVDYPSSANSCSLLTGSWDATTDLNINIGPSGRVYGAGGDGGNGGSYGSGYYTASNGPSQSFPTTAPGGNGGDGTTAIAIQYPTRIINNGVIRSGRGGGGGGATGYGYDVHDVRPCANGRSYPLIGGAGGAGGSGYPAGSGGLRSIFIGKLENKQGGTNIYSENGTSGSLTVDGIGGAGGYSGPGAGGLCGSSAAYAGVGGGAGQRGGDSQSGNVVPPGQGGANGHAIIIDSTGSIVSGSVIANGIDGDIVNGISS